MSSNVVLKAKRKSAKQGAADTVDIFLKKDRCKGCRYCVEICPRKTLAIGEEMNAKGNFMPKVVENGECAACGLCTMICPDFAIWLSSEDEEASDG
jgi:2-oxoglutarate ferredoxin oxidoreductase subunit delta